MFQRARAAWAAWAAWAGAILGLLAACASPLLTEDDAELPPAAPPPSASAALAPAGAPATHPRSRWLAAGWHELPGWDFDRVSEVWVALLAGCGRPAPGWSQVCADALLSEPLDDAATRSWLMQRLQPYRVESPEGNPDGLITGYYEPLVEANRTPGPLFRVPLHRPPADLATRKPYWTRQQIDTLPVAAASLRGREIAYVSQPYDALVLQIQGSGRLQLTEPDGSQRLVRVAFAAHNDQPYRSVGRWLIENGEISRDQASAQAIRAWAQRNPQRLNEMMWSNPRVVFFREEPLPDPLLGPNGAQGVPLTPGRSIAVDPLAIPYGTPVWLDASEPLSNTPLRRLVMAQDTGSAITGAVRADFFWGWGSVAEQQAGRMKQPLRMWVLWPRG